MLARSIKLWARLALIALTLLAGISAALIGTRPAAADSLTGTINGHLTWQGIKQPDVCNADQTATLTLRVNGVPQTYTVTTDQYGNFTMNNLPTGTFQWVLKGAKNLATGGTITINGVSAPPPKDKAPTARYEFGLQLAGDSNNDNTVTIQDYSIVKTSFGKGIGQLGYDDRADFNCDDVVTIADFMMVKNNFGLHGAELR